MVSMAKTQLSAQELARYDQLTTIIGQHVDTLVKEYGSVLSKGEASKEICICGVIEYLEQEAYTRSQLAEMLAIAISRLQEAG